MFALILILDCGPDLLVRVLSSYALSPYPPLWPVTAVPSADGVPISHPRFVGGDQEPDPPLDAATHAEPDEDADGDAEAEHDSRIHGGQDAQASGVNE